MLMFDVHLLEIRGLDLVDQNPMSLRFEYYRQQRPARSLAHYRLGELFYSQNNYQSAANEFRARVDCGMVSCESGQDL